MEVIPRSTKTTTELHYISNKWKDRRSERSPERTKVWNEPQVHSHKQRKVAVVYYLSRNGQLEHPHFVEVPLSSSDGLYLRDVIDRLNSLRGKGMAALYSWSSKRSYKNGFVWHDLAENDFIYPVHGLEYVLKGSELVDGTGVSFISKSDVASKKSSPPETPKSGDDINFPIRSRNQSWTAIDLHEYKVYSGESSAGRVAADASTQTEEKRRRWKSMITDNESSELSRDEISPPPSDSSPETLESLLKSDGKLIVRPQTDDENGNVNPPVENKMKASSVLMQLISCGSMSFRDCGPGVYGKHNPGFSLVKSRMLPRGEGASNQVEKGAGENDVVCGGGKKLMTTEEKEYFSGSLIETKKDEIPALKRSNSYNADA